MIEPQSYNCLSALGDYETLLSPAYPGAILMIYGRRLGLYVVNGNTVPLRANRREHMKTKTKKKVHFPVK